jgi:crotonobetainyl-CoA:carnitine CoA-transferase CaiB-like acyl-CoA transferase
MAVLRDLISRADVLLSNTRPIALERLGLAPDEVLALNRRLVYATITAEGYADPVRRNLPGFAVTFGAASGVSDAVTPPGAPPAEFSGWGDYAVGNQFALAVVDALRHRAQADGVFVDVNATAALTLLACDTALVQQHPGFAPAAPSGLVACADGLVAFDARGTRLAAADGSFAGRSTDAVVEELRGRGYAAARQCSIAEVAGGMNGLGVDPFTALDHHVLLGRRRNVVRTAWSRDGRVAGASADAPWLGEHTLQVAAELLGLSQEEADQLIADGTIG